MPGHETDLEIIGRTRSSAPERSPQTETPAHAAELSSRALADGRPATLDTPSVVHLQALAGNASVARLLEDEQAPDKVRAVVGQGGGERLDATTANAMGARFGEDFGDVRIHQGGAAAESARAVNAQAYTIGNDVVFDSGRFDPGSPAGERTLAHELTHVVQQRQGAVSGSDIGGGLAVSDPADRFEREASATADRVLASPAPTTAPATAQRHAQDEPLGSATAQREEEPEEEEMGAGAIAQRQAAGDEEEEELQP